MSAGSRHGDTSAETGMIEHPLILLPALGSDERLWQPLVERVEGLVECRVLRGEGETIAAMAASVLERAPDRFYLAGNSMGGYVALEIALNHPERVLGLALLNTSAIAAPPDRRANSLAAIDAVASGQFEAVAARISAAVAPDRPEIAALAARMAIDLGPDVFVAQQRAVADRGDRRAELANLGIPVLVVAGSADAITPPQLSEELAALTPEAQLRVLDGIGHLSPVEAPAMVASALLSWLLGISGRGIAR